MWMPSDRTSGRTSKQAHLQTKRSGSSHEVSSLLLSKRGGETNSAPPRALARVFPRRAGTITAKIKIRSTGAS